MTKVVTLSLLTDPYPFDYIEGNSFIVFRGVGSCFKMGGQEHKSLKLVAKRFFFNKEQAIKWVGNCPHCTYSSYAPVVISFYLDNVM